MKWISFKDKLPPSLNDFLLWDCDIKHGQMIELAWMDKEKEVIHRCCSLMSIRKLIYVSEVLKKDFYWMTAPKGPK